jgi:hypothetical protein
VLNINGERVLGDGHNRLEICRQTGIRYTTREIPMPSREAAIQWVIDNQLPARMRQMAHRSSQATSQSRPASSWHTTPGGTATHLAHAAAVSATG